MERAIILSSLAGNGTGTAPRRVVELADELGMPAADLLAVAGHPVPVELLPPERDARVLRQFAYRVSHCGHSQLAALEAFVRSLPRVAAPEPFVRPARPYPRPAETRFAAVLGGLIRNRGFGIRELPFMGLSLSTLYGMVWRWEPGPHRCQQLCAVAGPLGWTLPDLFAVADEPYSEELRPVLHCHHLGRVLTAAVPLSTSQLIETAEEADRLSVRQDHGVWRPVSQGFAEECPDFP
ncbi:hypothetical protein [Streptomyces triticiradicis]|uniref:Uncharacterized protein n=1 Tax=Streptomyces triticiradicis TaxID=2651189 RepID=A0A7J5DHN2_9ACTN|nr:hypothetical protein [Streptomyces triticiradicis]KAB1988166.1 hypothetical protein F8144_13120 [Streptomyces triticiradicis]